MNLNNECRLIGRLTADPEVKPAGETVLTQFTLAVQRPAWGDREKVTDFIRCKMWGKRGEAFAQYHTKGKTAHVSGSYQIDKREKDGEKKEYHYVNCSDWAFIYSDKPGADKPADLPADMPADMPPSFSTVPGADLKESDFDFGEVPGGVPF